MRLEDDLTAIGVDHVMVRLLAAPCLGGVRNLPAILAADIGQAVVEGVEDFLGRQAKRLQQRRDRQLALAVDADVDDVLGVEFEIEPAAAIGDDAGGEEIFAAGVGLAAVMIEQHARRTVHLADDDALGAVDDEGAVLRHERHVAHVTSCSLISITDLASVSGSISKEVRRRVTRIGAAKVRPRWRHSSVSYLGSSSS
jgi:hypothetical protein